MIRDTLREIAEGIARAAVEDPTIVEIAEWHDIDPDDVEESHVRAYYDARRS